MARKSDSKPFTAAQQSRLTALIQALASAQRDVNNFTGYLSDEHQAIDGTWDIAPDYSGFIRKQPEG